MVIITVLAFVLAVFYDTKWLAVLGLIGGFLTPLVLSTGQDNQIALMTYMSILNLGLLSIAFYKKWDLLNFLGFIITDLLYTSWFAVHYASSKFWPSIIFLNIFYLMYAVIPFAYQFFRITGEQMRGFLIMTPNSLFAFGYSYFMIRQLYSLEWVGIISLSYALTFLLMASYLYMKGVYQDLADYDSTHRFYSWLYRIALNESINQLNGRKRVAPVPEDEPSDGPGPEQVLDAQMSGRRIQAALITLKDEYRAVIVLRHFVDCSYEEMAEVLQLPEKTVKSRLFSARQLLRHALQQTGMTPP